MLFLSVQIISEGMHVFHSHTHTHTYGGGCPGGPTEVSIPHGESFLALGFAYPLLYSLQSRPRDPTQLQDS